MGKLRSWHFNEVFLLTGQLLYLETFDQWGRGPSLHRGLVTPQLWLRGVHVSFHKPLQPLTELPDPWGRALRRDDQSSL